MLPKPFFTGPWDLWEAAKVDLVISTFADKVELYLVPFNETMRPSFTDAELIHVIEAMAARGLRLRSDPVGFTASLEAADILPSDEELEDDELRFLRERQANKPY
jgi:hypothetical protein